MEFKTIPTDQIRIPENALRGEVTAESVQQLAQSIKDIGLINPVTVKKIEHGWEVVAGHRRLTAVRHLGHKEVRCCIIAGNTLEAETIKAAENIQRKQLDVVEEAIMVADMSNRFHLSQAELGAQLHKSQSWVADRIALISYPDVLLAAVKEGRVSFSVARELAKIRDAEDLGYYLNYAEDSGVNPATARKWAQDWRLRARRPDVTVAEVERDAHAEQGPPDPVLLRCDVCRTSVDIESIKMLRVCPNCMDPNC